MWICKNDYNELIRSRDFWSDEYNRSATHCISLLEDLDRALNANNELKSDNRKLRVQAETYKQKYADEVQKRLELIKLLKK